MAGGMEIYIDGSGMDEQPQLNTVLFSSTTQANLELAGTPQDSKWCPRAMLPPRSKSQMLFAPLAP